MSLEKAAEQKSAVCSPNAFLRWVLNISMQKQGFTLIELIVVISVVISVALLTLVSFKQSRALRDLISTGQSTLSILQRAQSKTLAGEDNSSWGVHLTSSHITLFRGTMFEGATSLVDYPLSSTLEIVHINLAGGSSDIVFKKITGTTDQAGSFDIRINDTPASVFSITVDSSGKVYQTGPLVLPTGTRIIDARHRLFTLGWSIQTAHTLTLRFSDPPNADTVQNITMASYFDGPKTIFDWSGSILVGGQAQTLRIHTTSLSGSNTLLSVDRDCRLNTKKVKISIDTTDIAAYEADCHTITVEPLGGTMSEL